MYLEVYDQFYGIYESMWVGQGWNRKLVVGNEFGMNVELARFGSGSSYLDYGQAFLFDFKCSEKLFRDFKGENGMIIYVEIFRVMVWVVVWRRG